MLRCIRDVRAISTRHAILSKSRSPQYRVKSANKQIIRLLLQCIQKVQQLKLTVSVVDTLMQLDPV